MGASEVVSDLRNLSSGDRFRVSLSEGLDSLTLYAVDDVFYEEPDQFGGGFVELSVEVDSDVHEIGSDRIPTGSGNISASARLGRWKSPTVSLWDPVEEDGVIVSDEWESYTILTVEALGD